MEPSIFDGLRKEIQSIYADCKSQELEFRYFFSFVVFDPQKREKLGAVDYTGVFGEKKTVLKSIELLNQNLEFEPGNFINV